MAFTDPPYSWRSGIMATAPLLNQYVRDQQVAFSIHTHDGSAGEGNDELTGIDVIAMDDIGNPGVAGKVQRNGANVLFGATNFNMSNEDDVAGVACLRSLVAQAGAGANDAVAGNHTTHY